MPGARRGGPTHGSARAIYCYRLFKDFFRQPRIYKECALKQKALGEIISQVAAARWVPQLAKSLGLDLTYPFTRHLEVSSNFF
jgi:hypothetical protein